MSRFDDLEAWRQVPPEVKLEMMARAHSKGLLTALGTILVASTCAIALQEVLLMWAALCIAPIIFQFSANHAWRSIKPQSILRYLAARSAARRYAYTAKAEDLTLDLIFQGYMEPVIDPEDSAAVIQAAIDNLKDTEVWITLFRDTIVFMSEQPGGAKLEAVYPIDHKLSVASTSSDGEDYSLHKEVFITVTQKGLVNLGQEDTKTIFKVTSRYPAALVVFEKKIQEIKRMKAEDEGKRAALMTASSTAAERDLSTVEDDDDDFPMMDFGSFDE